MNINCIKGLGTIALLLVFSTYTQATLLIDSIGVENNNGKQVILHSVQAKETYYSLARKYASAPRDIIAFNNNKALKIGDVIKIPTQRSFNDSPIVATAPNQPNSINNNAPGNNSSINNNTANEETVQYRVGAGETLYTIAKRFQVTVAQIVTANNLRNGQAIKAGQLLDIPQGNVTTTPAAAVPAVAQRAPETEEEEEEFAEAEQRNSAVPANRYGLRQIDEKGIGVWMDGLNSDGGNMLALHKTAPVGTVVKITNPMSDKSTYAKIVGRYTDNSNTRDAVIVISKATANLLGILDKRFLINISYGVPNN